MLCQPNGLADVSSYGKDVFMRFLLIFESRKFIPKKKKRQRRLRSMIVSKRIGLACCIANPMFCISYRRGLTSVAYLLGRQCESLKMEISNEQTPTPFLYPDGSSLLQPLIRGVVSLYCWLCT